jgi:hypothetical protein
VEIDGRSRWSWALSAAAADMYIRGLSGEDLPGGCSASEELLAKGFAAAMSSGHLVCLPPEVPIIRAMALETQKWLSLRPDLDAMNGDLAELVAYDRVSVQRASQAVSEHHEPAECIRLLEGAFGGARHELLVMYLPLHEGPALRRLPPEFAPLDGGVSVRYLYDREVLDDSPFLAAVLEQIGDGAQARTVDYLPTDAVIVDRRTLLVVEQQRGPTLLQTTSAAMVESFSALFDLLWAGAMPLGVSASAAPHEMNERDQQILAKLLGADPVEKIGRDLHVNRRTIQRRANEIYQSFDVENRAQLREAVHRLSSLRQSNSDPT